MHRRSRSILIAAVIIAVLVLAFLSFRYYYFHRFDRLIEAASREHNLDPELIWSLVHEESLFDPRATGEAGEKGLMQVSPIVVREWASARGYTDEREALVRYFGSESKAGEPTPLFVPEVNLEVGSWYLRSLISKYQSEPQQLIFALAAYNAGPSNADRWLKSASAADRRNRDRLLARIEFPKTRGYVTNIVRRYEQAKGITAP